MNEEVYAIGGDRHVPHVEQASYPVREGNVVIPLVDGLAAFERICRAVEEARHSVWVSVAFVQRDVPMPGGRGSFFDVLDRAALRGLDVRALFWREPRFDELEPEGSHFPGNEQERDWLAARGSRFLARWDRHPRAYCHHQKSWVVDAGQPRETSFVGGINLLRESSLAREGHPPIGCVQDHDVYAEVRGPAATDVHHNFVQRWNEASERKLPDGTWPDAQRADDLAFPTRLSGEAGDVPVQVTRTIMAGCYTDEAAAPGALPFPIAAGEESIREQYISAIAAAETAIYVEDQAIASHAVVKALDEALQRGIEVAFLVPGNPHPAFVEARKNPEATPFFDLLARLGRFPNFTLAAIAGSRGDGVYDEVYVHAKIMLVDDAWATIGSTNVAERSFHRDTELNASFWHTDTVHALRSQLLHEHTGRDTSELSICGALQSFAEQARANTLRRARGEELDGLVYALDPNTYGA